jgi:hypothetical protein
MKSKIKYSEGPMVHLSVVKNFLPLPDKFVLRECNVKVTIFFEEI